MYVCGDCFEDYAIQDFIKDNAAEKECDYCGKKSASDDIAASLEEVVKFIVDGIEFEWDDPVNEVGWCSQEGGWLGAEVTDTYDLVAHNLELGIDNSQLFDDIVRSMDGEQWCRRNPYGPQPGEELLDDWDKFADQIKHRVRFVFFRTEETGRYQTLAFRQPHTILDNVGQMVKELGLINILPVNTEFVRVRVGKKKVGATVKQLGPPPQDKAIFSNRMSPAGIPMFYGSNDAKTAIVETYDKKDKSHIYATIAKFSTVQPFKVLDVTQLPEFPSLFDKSKRHFREPLIFLRSFLEDFSKPIKRDGREHIEYVPTQVVTEYFRHIFGDGERDAIKGIIYPSSRRKKGKSCVLFFEAKDCIQDNATSNGNDDKWLMLLSASVKSIKLK